jgi:hypothetical protein
VTRQVEGNQAVVFREPSLQLMAEYTTAGRVAVDQKHRQAALAALLDRQGAVRCEEGVLPSRNTHMAEKAEPLETLQPGISASKTPCPISATSLCAKYRRPSTRTVHRRPHDAIHTHTARTHDRASGGEMTLTFI